MPGDRYLKKLFSQDWNVKQHRGRLRKVWGRIINDLFVSLELDKAEWLKDILDDSSSLKAFLGLAGRVLVRGKVKGLRKDLIIKSNLLFMARQ